MTAGHHFSNRYHVFFFFPLKELQISSNAKLLKNFLITFSTTYLKRNIIVINLIFFFFHLTQGYHSVVVQRIYFGPKQKKKYIQFLKKSLDILIIAGYHIFQQQQQKNFKSLSKPQPRDKSRQDKTRKNLITLFKPT